MLTDKVIKALEQISEDVSYLRANLAESDAELPLSNMPKNVNRKSAFNFEKQVHLESGSLTGLSIKESPEIDDGIPSVLLYKCLLKLRQLRKRIFAGYPFSDPAWDMYIELSIASAIGRPITVTSLCIASNAPHTTALRYIDTMVEKKIIQKFHDPKDRRRVYIQLTKVGEDKMKIFDRYLRNELKYISKFGG